MLKDMVVRYAILSFIFIPLLYSCQESKPAKNENFIHEVKSSSDSIADEFLRAEVLIKEGTDTKPAPSADTVEKEKIISALEQALIDAGLVNIKKLDSNIVVDLRYSSEQNFLGIDIYGELNACYLQPEVAEKLVKAQHFLKSLMPEYNLLIYDGVRPRSIQQKMWEILDMPDREKIKYVSNPKLGSLHNFGAAVDASIADENGRELDMGTPFDFFGELAYPVKEKDLLKEGRLTSHQIENRRLLRRVMFSADFFNIQTEWWHFNSCYRKEAILKYTLIE